MITHSHYLGHLKQMDGPTRMSKTNPFPMLGMLSGILYFFPNCNRISREPDQKLRSTASDLSLHCLPMSHKKDANLICVNNTYTILKVVHLRSMYVCISHMTVYSTIYM